jgi:hypothetical protein
MLKLLLLAKVPPAPTVIAGEVEPEARPKVLAVLNETTPLLMNAEFPATVGPAKYVPVSSSSQFVEPHVLVVPFQV